MDVAEGERAQSGTTPAKADSGEAQAGPGPEHFGILAAGERQDWDELARILIRNGLLLTQTESVEPAVAALAAMPESDRTAVLARHPRLRPFLEFCGLIALAEPYPIATQDLQRGDQRAADEITALVVALQARRLQGRFDLAAELATAAAPHVLTATRFPGSAAEKLAAGFFSQAADSYLMVGDDVRARRALQLSWRWRHVDALGFIAHRTAATLAAQSALAGALAEADGWVAESRRWPGKLDERYATHFGFGSPLAEFLCALDRLDSPGAEEFLVELPRDTATFELHHWVVWARVHGLLLFNRPAEALRLLDLETPPPGLPASHADARLRIDAYLAAGDTAAAAAALGREPADGWRTLRLARLAAMAGDAEGALRRLGEFTAPNRRLTLEASTLRAACLLSEGREQEARREFEHLLTALEDNRSAILTISASSARALLLLCSEHPRAGEVGRALREWGHDPVYPFAAASASAPRSGSGSGSRSGSGDFTLTTREAVILRYIADGVPRATIARNEVVSLNTVKSQVAALYRKLGATTAEQAVARARVLGLL